MAAPSRKLVVVSNEDSPRWRWLKQEPLPADLRLELLPWREVIRGGINLPEEPTILRIDSPDKDEGVARALMQLGDYDGHQFRRGEIRSPSHFHAGWVALLSQIATSLQEMPWVHPWLSPAAIIATFDKVETRERLSAAGLPHTTGFEPESVGTLIAELDQREWPHAYLKLRYGWSGTGIVYLDLEHKRGVSTVDDRLGWMASSRQLDWRPLAELLPILSYLIHHGGTCERAIPLAELDGHPFDVRMVVINERVRFTLFRQSHLPITNLHLAGWRADPARCRQLIEPRLWCDAMDAAVRATRLFHVPVAGVDVAFDRSRVRFAILELNAFGDFFPRLTDANGQTVHGAVLEAIAQTA